MTTQKQIILRKEYFQHKYYKTCLLANYKGEIKKYI